MLARATGAFVRNVDPDGSLIPLTRLNDSHKLHPLALVIKRSRRWFWQRHKYLPSDFTLDDLLLGDTPLCPDVMESDFLTYEGTFGDTVTGRLEGEAGPMTLNLEGRSSSKLQSSFGRLRKQEVDVQTLLQASKDRVLNLEHCLLRQMLQKRRVGLAVLKERIISTQSCSISQQVQGLASCGAMLALIGPTDVQVSVEEKGRLKSDSSVSMEIPEFTVIAYSVIELEIKHTGQFELCLGGFEVDGPVSEEGDSVPGGVPLSVLQKDSLLLSGLKAQYQLLVDLPAPTRSTLLQHILNLLCDRPTVTLLEDLLERLGEGEALSLDVLEGCSSSQEETVRGLLDLLQDQSSSKLLTSIHLLISAMEEMSDASLVQLHSCCSSRVLKSLQDLVSGLMVNGESALAEEEVCRRAELLFSSSNVELRREKGRLWAETGARPGLRPLFLCIAVQGLASLSTGF